MHVFQKERERCRERKSEYKRNRSFDVLDESRTALILSRLVPVVPPNVLGLHTAQSIAIHGCILRLSLTSLPPTATITINNHRRHRHRHLHLLRRC